MEEQSLYDTWDFNVSTSAQNPNAFTAQIGSLVCPSNANASSLVYDGTGTASPLRGLPDALNIPGFTKANYAAFVGPQHIDHQRFFPGALGGFKPGKRIGQKIGKVRDGVSKTVLASEVRALQLEWDHRGVWSMPFPGSSLLSLDWHHLLQPGESWQAVNLIERYIPDPEHDYAAQLPNGNTAIGDTLFECKPAVLSQMNLPKCSNIGSFMSASPRSNHPGGVNAVALDGHTGFLSDNIDSFTYAYLISSKDGQPSDVTQYIR